jgi:hypothetical protein
LIRLSLRFSAQPQGNPKSGQPEHHKDAPWRVLVVLGIQYSASIAVCGGE